MIAYDVICREKGKCFWETDAYKKTINGHFKLATYLRCNEVHLTTYKVLCSSGNTVVFDHYVPVIKSSALLGLPQTGADLIFSLKVSVIRSILYLQYLRCTLGLAAKTD